MAENVGATMPDLRPLMESITAMRDKVEKRLGSEQQEVKDFVIAEVKKFSDEYEKKLADAIKAVQEIETERKMRFGQGDSNPDLCKFGEPLALRRNINLVKAEYAKVVGGDMRLQDYLSLIATGYQGQMKNPLLDKLPRMAWDPDGSQTKQMMDLQQKRLLEDGGFYGIAASTGGYLVFPEYLAEIVPFIRQAGVVRRLARVMPMAGLIMQWPTCTTGSTWAWIAEDGAKTDNDFIFNFGTLRNHMMYSITYVSNQMLADSRPSVETFIREDFGRGAGATEDIAFIRGTAIAADPILGILSDPLVPALPALAIFDYDDLIAMWAVVQTAIMTNAVRPATLANAAAIAHLAAVKDLNGQYIWREPLQGTMDGAIGRVPFLGPIYVDENIQTAAGPPMTTSMIYGDWNEAIIGDREEMIIMPNPYETVAFQHNAVAFRAERRVGWALRRPTAFVKLTGAQL